MREHAPWVLMLLMAVTLLATRACPGPSPGEDPEVQRLRTALLSARAEAQGWYTALVEGTMAMEQQLMAAEDSMGLLAQEKAELAREVLALGGEIRVMADMVAELRGQLEAQGTTHGPAGAPDSVTAPIADGLLEGRVAYFPGPSRFALDYVARLSLVLGVVEAPDGRALLVARGTDPRVQLSYGQVYYQPPAPLPVCGLGERLRWGGYGLVAGAGIRTVVELVGVGR